MGILLAIIAFALLAAGLLGAILPVLPGPPLSYSGLLLLKWSGHGGFSPAFLIIWAAITVVVTVADYLLPAFMAKRFGGSRYAAIGSIIGLVAGIFIFPPWGIIIGPFFGALAGELLHNSANGRKALKVAFGAFLAFIAGAGAKLIVSSLMIYYAIMALIH